MVRVENMRRMSIRTLVAVIAALAVFGFVYPDDGSESDLAGRSEIVLKTPEKLPTHRDGRARSSPFLIVLSKSTCAPSSHVSSSSSPLASLSTSILRC